MAKPQVFDFGADSVAAAYDEILVPLLFEPWARSLLDEHPDWAGRRVLDLAAGTGIVARLASERAGPDGAVTAVDLNSEMLERARHRCAGCMPAVEFVESPAYPLNIPSESIDIAVCQQGLQFFPDKAASLGELRRVLRPGGRALASVWLPVEDCSFFAWVCEALTAIGESEMEALMRLPFDHLGPSQLRLLFEEAGFANVSVQRKSAPLVMQGGLPEALTAIYATPIGPKLRLLASEQRTLFEQELRTRVEHGSPDGVTMGDMVASVLRADNPRS